MTDTEGTAVTEDVKDNPPPSPEEERASRIQRAMLEEQNALNSSPLVLQASVQYLQDRTVRQAIEIAELKDQVASLQALRGLDDLVDGDGPTASD